MTRPDTCADCGAALDDGAVECAYRCGAALCSGCAQKTQHESWTGEPVCTECSSIDESDAYDY